MRVLFVCFAHDTHYFPMVPLAWALRTAGHEVRVASGPDLADTIARTGLPGVSVGTPEWYSNDPYDPEALGELLAEGSPYAEYFDYTRRDEEQWTWEGLLALENIMVPALFASMNNDPTLDDLVGVARDWRPDLVIWETYSFAGAVAARAVGAAHARLVWGADVALRARREFLRRSSEQPPEHREDPTAEWLGWSLERFGGSFDEEVLTGQWTIDPSPAPVRLDLGLDTVGVRYVPYPGPVAAVPEWPREEPKRARVCLSLGLSGTAERMGATLGEVLESMADLDAEVIATLTEEQVAAAGTLPDNVRAVGFAPLDQLLPSCAAIVHHGGIGTTATAYLHGVPQLLLSGGWDTAVKADAIEAAGAGLRLPLPEVTRDKVGDAVRRLLTEPSFTRAAMTLREHMLAEPTLNEAVTLIERRVSRHGAARGAGGR